MTAWAWSRRDNLTPAFTAALALHLAVFAAVLLLKTPSSLLPTGAAVPIEIVSSVPAQAADEAPAPAPAQVPPAAPPEKMVVAPPSPPAAPTPPVGVQKATAAAAMRPLRPIPARIPDREAKPLNLDALAASIAKAAPASPARAPAAPRAVRTAAAGPAARADEGPVSQNDLQGLQQLLERLWNPNCGVAGADSVIVPVKFAVGSDGRVDGRVAAGQAASADPAIASAARRAIDAVHEAEPYASDYRGKDFTVNFDARKACSER